MSQKSTPLQTRIERTAARLAALKAQAAAREAREKARLNAEARTVRNRALMLWGIALECAVLADPGSGEARAIRALLERHLTRDRERDAALDFLSKLAPSPVPKDANPPEENRS